MQEDQIVALKRKIPPEKTNEILPIKKVKIEDEVKECMDPLNYIPEELHDLIFQHLNVLNASEVSTSWYKSIAASRECMKKLKLKFDVPFEDFDICDKKVNCYFGIVNTPRKYKSIHFNCHRCLSFSRLCWKLILHQERMIDFNINNMILKGTIAEATLPNLENLKIKNRLSTQSISLLERFKNSKNIKKLELISIETVFTGILQNSSLIESLKIHENLVELRISSNIFDILFRTDVAATLKFKLKVLEIHTELRCHIIEREDIDRNFNKFLLTQRDCLESISLPRIYQFYSKALLHTIFKDLKVINTVCFSNRHFEDGDHESFSLHTKNTTIKKLTFGYQWQPNAIMELLTAAPNVVELKVDVITKELMKFVARNMTKLRRLEWLLDWEGGIKHYNKLKTRKRVNRKIRIPVIFTDQELQARFNRKRRILVELSQERVFLQEVVNDSA
ncbi:unnamed protein product [Diamesa serratosioi]